MFISQLSTENWVGNQNQGNLEQVTDWQQVEAAILDLDAHQKTLVLLETEGETHMAVGGGLGKYVVYVTFDNENFHYLIDPAKTEIEETLIVGGQEGYYPDKLCVDLTTSLKAAKTFAEIGILEKSVVWEKEGIFELV
jgi:hypothetical protein